MYYRNKNRVGKSAFLVFRPGALLRSFFLYALIVTPGGFLSGVAYGKPSLTHKGKRAEGNQKPENLQQDRYKAAILLGGQDLLLEERAWTSEDHEIYEVEKQVVRGLQKNPSSAFYHYLLSHVYIRIYALNPGRIDLLQKSGDLAEQAVMIGPGEVWGYLALTDLMDMLGKPRKASLFLANAKKSSQLAKYDWRISFAEARIVVEKDGPEKVLSLLEKSLNLPQASRNILIPFAATVIEDQYSGQESLQQLSEWNQKYPHPLLEVMIAINLTERGLYKQAREQYTSLLERYPDNFEARVNSAVLDYRYLSHPERGKKEFLSLLQKEGNNLSKDIWSVMHAHLGAIALGEDAFEKARGYFVEAVRSSPQKPMTMEFALNNYSAGKDFRPLVKMIESVIETNPGVADLHAINAEIYSSKLGDYARSVRFLENAILLDPENSDYYSALGLSHYHLNDMTKALVAFDQAVTLNPDDALSFYNKACVLSLMNQVKDALIALDQAIILNPHLQRLALTDEDFRNIRHLSAFHFVTRERGWTSVSPEKAARSEADSLRLLQQSRPH